MAEQGPLPCREGKEKWGGMEAVQPPGMPSLGRRAVGYHRPLKVCIGRRGREVGNPGWRRGSRRSDRPGASVSGCLRSFLAVGEVARAGSSEG